MSRNKFTTQLKEVKGLEQGQFLVRMAGPITATAWQDKKPISALSAMW